MQQEADFKRKYQTKIDFLQKENNQLRDENLNLQKLIKLQHEKQEILEEIKQIQCQYSQSYLQYERAGSLQSKSKSIQAKCNCQELQRTNSMLQQLFNKTMIENKRMVALISVIQNERDTALSKALIHEQIIEGLQLEEIDLIESLNGQIIAQKSCIQQQCNEIDTLNKKLQEFNVEKKGQNIIELEKFSTLQQKGEDKKTSQKVIELNSLLEQSLEQLNSKNAKIKFLEEQKNELIMINSLLTSELQQLKFNKKENLSLSKIIHNQYKIFGDEDMLSSNYSNLSYNEEVLPDKVNFKKDKEDGVSQNQRQYSNSPMYKTLKKNQSNQQGGNLNIANSNNNNISNLYLITEGQQGQINSQNNMSYIKPNEQNQSTNPNLAINKLNTLNNSFQNASVISNLNVPKLDLTKAFKVQQISVNNQMKQEQIKQQIYSQYKSLIEKRKLLQKRRQEKLITEEQYLLNNLQFIQQDEELVQELKPILEESSLLQEEIKKSRKSLETSYFNLRQQENLIDTLKRDLADAVDKNTILIQSNIQYENKWKKFQIYFSAYKDFYLSQQSTSLMNTCSTRNHNLTSNQNGNNNNNNNQINISNNIPQYSNTQQPYSPYILSNSEKQNNFNQSHLNHQYTSQVNNVTLNNNNYSHQISINQINHTSSINPFIPSAHGAIDLEQIPQNQNYVNCAQNQPYFQYYEQLGQKVFDEQDVQNSVFVPLSLRKNNEKHYLNIHTQRINKRCNQYQFISNSNNQNEEQKINIMQSTVAAAPFSSNNFQNVFSNPQSQQLIALNVFNEEQFGQKYNKFNQPQVKNIQEAKSKIISLAQELYFCLGLNKIIPNQMESPIQNFQKLYKTLDKSNQNPALNDKQKKPSVAQKKKRSNNFKSRSFSPQWRNHNNRLVPLPFRCFLKYKNIQPLRALHVKTMSMHNEDKLNFKFSSTKINSDFQII
ncbi:hypothetical protein TTHERM_00013510 (macronuclear) [Tetrahymena thermophila SB210]|uniref:Uncharacterized protein n=1 Tax=Tetrahymena thermophila (strain SB210) TaxID=312017 RepID=Q22RN7_TETTS|nr:hypothetical protein TTHERM_00013510 [Tetrahymena thermophila SB210]EAR88085.2 hypothetical protein TTHERM_00013510 [Tetrahymena thermophila SB210]|eukprot:XP_001008330.2 hypothetical protein TTHERM_00013510 [Tetrahymena thermophila SB210]